MKLINIGQCFFVVEIARNGGKRNYYDKNKNSNKHRNREENVQAYKFRNLWLGQAGRWELDSTALKWRCNRWRYNSVTMPLEWCYNGIAMGLRWRYSGAEAASQWRDNGAAMALQMCHSIFIMAEQWR